jgi:biphenyl 2,3-dioxygenase beta subunit
MNLNANATSIEDVVLQHEIERALYDEAALLDAHDYAGWLASLTDDVTYWMPIRETRSAEESDREFTAGGGAYFDEDRRMLELRVEKRGSGYAWSEDPPSRTRHCVTNVRIMEKHASGDVTVACNMVVYRSRLDADEDWWVGRRIDRLRIVDGRWRLARREVYLDQTVLLSKNLSTFF